MLSNPGVSGRTVSRESGEKVKKEMTRENLRDARKEKGLTQQNVADYLGISLRYYQNIEAGDRTGDFEIWDNLEDLFNIYQRKLRETSNIRRDQANNQ